MGLSFLLWVHLFTYWLSVLTVVAYFSSVSVFSIHPEARRTTTHLHPEAQLPFDFDFLTFIIIFYFLQQNMDIDYLDFGDEVFLWINSPLVLLNLVANSFYAFCLEFPRSSGAKLKQPLKTLLKFLVWNAIAFLTYLFCMYEVVVLSSSPVLYIVSWTVVLCNVQGSIMTSALLSFYYYIQIVPFQRAFFLWVKKNIKLVVYTILLYQQLFILLNGLVNGVNLLSGFSKGCNGTLTDRCLKNTNSSGLVSFFVIVLHILACLVVMTVCNFSLVHYLSCHIKNVAKGGVLTTKTGRQLRVTISSVFQGVLYFVYCTLYFLGELAYIFSDYTLGIWVTLTINTLYISGTTVNIGIGHTVFRKRAARVWRALTVRCGAGTPANS